jgi:pantothenate kinase-related protein Tda10
MSNTNHTTADAGMQSPELLLARLNRSLRELHGAAYALNDEEIDVELVPVMRRLLVAEVVGNAWIVAVGGSQGSGKTTLVRTMYDLGADKRDWLPPPMKGAVKRFPS